MGNCCQPHRKVKFIKQDNPIYNTAPTSQVHLASENQPDVFKKIQLEFENQQIIRTFEFLPSKYQFSALTQPYANYNWRKVPSPQNKNKHIFAICKWNSDQDRTLQGPGFILNKEKNNQFMVGGQFSQGRVIASNQYFKILSTGAYYIGQLDGELSPHGQGQLHIDKDGKYYRGSFFKGVPHGRGEHVQPKKKFEGEFRRGEIVRGKQITPKGSYQGQFKNNLRHGKGILRMNSGLTFEGEFEQGKKVGPGILKDRQNKVISQGVWKDDKKLQ